MMVSINRAAAGAAGADVLAAAAEKVQKALMHLVLHKPFFGSLVLRLKVSADTQGHPTMWTDGRAMRYNPAFVMQQSFEHLVMMMAHEVGHCALAHPYRRGTREQRLFNQAADYAVNALLKADGSFAIPPNCLYDQRFEGMASEQIYAVLEREQQAKPKQPQQPQQQDQPQQGQGGGQGSGAGGQQQPQQPQQQQQQGKQEQQPQQQKPQQQPKAGSAGAGEAQEQQQEMEQSEGADDSLADSPGTEQGDVLDAGTSGKDEEEGEGIEGDRSEARAMSEAELQQEMDTWMSAAVAAAMSADALGKASAGVKRIMTESFAPMQTYAEYLRLFCSQFSKDEESWSRPSRRAASQGVYLPALHSEGVGSIVIAIDTSGSISQTDLAHFQAEMQQIHAELRPEELIVLYSDARVHSVQRIGRYDEVAFDPKKVKGGGGTDFCPVFKWTHVHREEGERIVGIIYVTDLEGGFPKQNEEWFDPQLPVLWVATDRGLAPFGETCHLTKR